MTTLDTMKIDTNSEIRCTKLRKDSRAMLDMQEIFIQKGAKTDSITSLYLETTHLKLLCSINGPIYLSTISKAKSDDANKMNVNVNLVFPSYLDSAPNKNSL